MATLSSIITPTNILTESSAGTLTNKIISGADNTLTNVPLATAVSGTLPAANGGTGLTSAGTSGNVLVSNGTAWTSAAGPKAPTQQVFTANALTGTFARGASFTGTYTRTSPSATVTVTATNTFAAGDRVYLDYTSGTAVDGWQTVISATGANFTVTSSATTTTSGNVTVHRPIVITVNSHGLSTAGTVYVDFSATFTDQTYTVYQATTDTFQVQIGTTGASATVGSDTSGTVILPQVYANPQTWTKPSGCKAVLVELVGGGGGRTSNTNSARGGGGGYSRELIDVTATSSVSVTIGQPGVTSNSSQNTGGTTSFGAFLSATGGGPASFSCCSQVAGASGLGSNGTLNLAGGGGSSYLSFGNVGFGVGINQTTFDATPGAVYVTEYY